MKLFVEGTLKLFAPKSFKGSDGVAVTYNECFIETGDASDGTMDIWQTNTKQDLSAHIGVPGVFTVNANAIPGAVDALGKKLKSSFKLSIESFTPASKNS